MSQFESLNRDNKPSCTLATASQLGLSFDSNVVHTWKDVAVAPATVAAPIFSVALTRHGARLELQGPWPEQDNSLCPDSGQLTVLWEADVQMRAPARARVSASLEGAQLATVDGLPLDLVAAPLGWAAEAVDTLPASEGAAFLTAMGRSLEQVARHLLALAVGARGIDRAHAGCSGACKHRFELRHVGLSVFIGDSIGHAPLCAAEGETARVTSSHPLPGREIHHCHGVHPSSKIG